MCTRYGSDRQVFTTPDELKYNVYNKYFSFPVKNTAKANTDGYSAQGWKCEEAPSDVTLSYDCRNDFYGTDPSEIRGANWYWDAT